jgi:hypothetical protein
MAAKAGCERRNPCGVLGLASNGGLFAQHRDDGANIFRTNPYARSTTTGKHICAVTSSYNVNMF